MIRLRGRDVTVLPELVRDAGEVDRLLRLMMTGNSRLASFVPFIGSDGVIDPATLQAALDHGFCIVRWRLTPD